MAYRNRTYSREWGRPIREEKAGNIYYLRLKTALGPLYKLGFTTMPSVHERLAFKGEGHEQHIDKVLGFAYSPNALSIEQTLHGHFDNKRAFGASEPLMPFAGNGQSELYIEDILGLDKDFTRAQARQVRVRIHAQRTGQPVEAVQKEFDRQALVQEDVRDVMNLRLAWPISWLGKAWCLIEEAFFTNGAKKKYEEKVQGMIHWYRQQANPGGSPYVDAARAERQAKIDARMQADALVLQAQKARQNEWPSYVDEARADRQARIHARIQADAEAAERLVKWTFGQKLRATIEAIHDHKPGALSLVDVNRLLHNLAEAMTENMTFGSDYMGVANNCDLMELMDAISNGNPRDVLMVPVQEGYNTLLWHWVKTGELLSEDLPIPEDPLFYRTADGVTHKVSPISECCFGPSVFIKALGREWHWPRQPGRIAAAAGEEWAEFHVKTRHAESGFVGRLVVRIEPIPGSGKLEVSFPNFYAEYRRAIDQASGDVSEPALPSPELKKLLRDVTGFARNG